jgi:phospholipase C
VVTGPSVVVRGSVSFLKAAEYQDGPAGYSDPLDEQNFLVKAMCTSAIADSGIAGGYEDRCGPGPRLPLLVLTPWSKANYVDHKATEQASILKFVEDNWLTGRIGDSSFDQRAGSLNGMFSFKHPNGMQVVLKTDGSVQSVRYLCGQFNLPHC